MICDALYNEYDVIIPMEMGQNVAAKYVYYYWAERRETANIVIAKKISDYIQAQNALRRSPCTDNLALSHLHSSEIILQYTQKYLENL